MRKFLKLFALFFMPGLLMAFNSINTTLVVVEESDNENHEIIETPFTDGVINALWEKPYIIFDIKPDKPLSFNSENLNYRPFISIAESGSADSILLIKANYQSIDEQGRLRILLKEVHYCLYAIHSKKIITYGTKKVDFNQLVSKGEKYRVLKKTGIDLLLSIYP
ncbi:MAG: hypothetical protein MJB14_03050 [Spirochaetes bacterium]|nr:hypothetical protein [Spirochaetota bacterium]